MRILGIDTSSEFLSIALAGARDIIIEESYLLGRAHSSLLIPKIDQLLKNVNLDIDDIDGFVIGLGPGSFTGLRIGVSAIKGFYLATKKPCMGVASIDAIALNAYKDDFKDKLIVPIIDAKRNQVYSALYKNNNSRLSRKSDFLLLSVENLMKKIKGETVFLGDGINLYKEKIQSLNKKAIFLEKDYWYPKASNLIKLARIKGKYSDKDLGKLRPIYLYPQDCQVKKIKFTL